MNELAAQRLVIQAVKSVGGTGWKLSNKFLIGVPDLLLCLPGQAVGIWEVKISDRPKTVDQITLKLTPLQDKTLGDLAKAGGYCGVISFMRTTGEIEMDAWLYKTLAYEDNWISKHRVDIRNHEKLRRGEREQGIIKVLNKAWSYFNRVELS